jgi:hypothetical protein
MIERWLAKDVYRMGREEEYSAAVALARFSMCSATPQ